MESDIVIRAENLSKAYKLYDNPIDRLKESIHPFRKRYHRDFYALNNIDFEVKKGESVGIIGKNGSGKSTLLKILTGVLTPTTGTVIVNGKVASLLELGAGFNFEMTGVENVYFNGTVTGFSKQEMDAKLDAILSFADIGDFVHQPVKTYSSGMFVRLAFAAAISVEPDILIIDEALSVGDVFFQQKCYSKIRKNIDKGTTCIFVSHDTNAIMNICSRTILLNEGAIDFSGKPEEAVSRYYAGIGKKRAQSGSCGTGENNYRQNDEIPINPVDIRDQSILPGQVRRHGAGGLLITAVKIVNEHRVDTMQVEILKPLYFFFLLQAIEDIDQPGIAIHIYDRLGNLVFAAGTYQLEKKFPSLKSGDYLVARMKVTFSVQPGDYTFNLQAGEPSAEGPHVGYIHDTIEKLGPISVYADLSRTLPFYGIAQLPVDISVGSPISSASHDSDSTTICR